MNYKNGMKYLVENKIILNNIEYTYIINYKKMKNIYFRVKDDLIIYVSAPLKTSERYIKELLIKEAASLEKLYNKALSKNDNKLLYLGEELEFIYENTNPRINGLNIYGRTEEECEAYIYSKALNIFSLRMDAIKATFHNLPEFRLRVRKMTTRWGVCNKNSYTVTLNTELIKKSVHLIDYVIIHELCHFKHMNHSKEFWDYVETYYPYYKIARKELKY